MVFPHRYYLLPCINLFPSCQITYVITQNFVCVYLFLIFTRYNINGSKRSPVNKQPLFIYLVKWNASYFSFGNFSNFLHLQLEEIIQFIISFFLREYLRGRYLLFRYSKRLLIFYRFWSCIFYTIFLLEYVC